jgi:hypothetical protein
MEGSRKADFKTLFQNFSGRTGNTHDKPQLYIQFLNRDSNKEAFE